MYFRNLRKDLREEVVSSRLPLRHLIITTIAIFMIETGVMVFMHRYLAIHSKMAEIMDAALLVILLSPALYLFLFRPMLRQIIIRKRAESVLQMERDKLKSILDAMEDGVCIVGGNHDVLYTNPVLELMLGPAGGQKCYQYLYESATACPGCAIEGAAGTVQREWTSAQGKRTYSIFEAPLKSANGSTAKLEILHDVSDQKRTEEALKDSERHLRHLSTQILSAQETEKRRISMELHDQLGQDLVLLKIRLQAIERTLSGERSSATADLENLLLSIDAAINNIRRIARDLSPSVLEDIGLVSALRTMAAQYGPECQVRLSFDSVDIDRHFTGDDRVVIYRLIQESLTNILKHAGAHTIACAARQDGAAVIFSVEDDGKGFSPREVVGRDSAKKGMGLATMEQRVRMLGGSLDIHSRPGKGTKVVFRIPITAARNDTHAAI